MKIRLVIAWLFRADRRTDGHITMLIVAFRNFMNAPKKEKSLSGYAELLETVRHKK